MYVLIEWGVNSQWSSSSPTAPPIHCCSPHQAPPLSPLFLLMVMFLSVSLSPMASIHVVEPSTTRILRLWHPHPCPSRSCCCCCCLEWPSAIAETRSKHWQVEYTLILPTLQQYESFPKLPFIVLPSWKIIYIIYTCIFFEVMHATSDPDY